MFCHYCDTGTGNHTCVYQCGIALVFLERVRSMQSAQRHRELARLMTDDDEKVE